MNQVVHPAGVLVMRHSPRLGHPDPNSRKNSRLILLDVFHSDNYKMPMNWASSAMAKPAKSFWGPFAGAFRQREISAKRIKN